MQSAASPNNIILVGYQSAKIEYNSLLNRWVLSDPRLNLTAWTSASQISYALGKHNWTISGDNYQCSKNQNYEIQLKLTACKEDEFTCDDGHCIEMEERCDQMSQCSDESDERNCKLLVLQSGYNKDIPPAIKRKMTARKKELFPVNVSLELLKVIDIDEIEYSFSFKFKILLMWRDNRVTFENLKKDSTNKE